MSVTFKADFPPGKTLTEWWQGLEKDRGSRAELRRAKSVTDVVMTPEFHRLCRRLRPFMTGESNWEDRIAMIAGIAAHLKKNESGKSAEQMAARKGEGPIVSELRFRRLLQRERKELYLPMIRILRLLDGKASLLDLANSVYYWGDKTKKEWAYTYFPHLLKE